MCDSGWIKLHRQTLNWEWFDDSLMVHLWVYILLRANHTDTKWHGINLKRGQFITSISSLCNTLKSTESRIKTALKRLKFTQQIETKTTNKFTIITVLNYEAYQEQSQTNDNQIANNSQTNDNQIATDKNDKNIKNIRNNNITLNNTNTLKEKRITNINPNIPSPKAEGGQKKDFIYNLLGVFSEEFQSSRKYSFDSMNEGPERSALGKMLKKHKEKYPDFTSEQTLDYFRDFFKKCLSIEDKWHSERMCPSHILNQITAIQAILEKNKEGKNNGQGKPQKLNLSHFGIE